MRVIICLAVLGMLSAAATAQPIPPHLMGAYSVGQAAYFISQAFPCFPRDKAKADELTRILDLAQSRIAANPEAWDAYQNAQMMSARQQRYIGRSDPVACQHAFDAVRYYLQQEQQ